MPTWTVSDDVRDRWVGTDAVPATDAQITTLLDDAEDSVLREIPDIATRILRAAGTDTTTGPSVPLTRVKKVVARMVIRHLRNPEGRRTTQRGAGPFQEGVTYGGDEPGALYLTDEDRRELGGAYTGGAFTIDSLPSPLEARSWTSGDTWEPLA